MSAGQALGGIVGGAVGFFVGGGPTGALYGAQIGMGVGGLIDPPKGPTINGPRLDDLSVQTSTYGAFIPRVYGTIATNGNIFWLENNKLKEVAKKTSSGGKGGGGGSTVKSYEYFATFAVGLADVSSTGPMRGIRRVWVGPNLIYDASSDDIESIIASNQASELFRFYDGDEDQLADPRMQADIGAADCPAYGGLAYIVFYDLPLRDYGNSLLAAQIKVELVSDGEDPGERILANRLRNSSLPPGPSSAMHMDADGNIVIIDSQVPINTAGLQFGYTYNIASGAQALTSSFDTTPFSGMSGGHIYGWSDVPGFAVIQPTTNYLIFYRPAGGALTLSSGVVNTAFAAANCTYHARGTQKVFVSQRASPINATDVYDVSAFTASLIFSTTTASSNGRLHDVFLGSEFNYGVTSAPKFICYDKDWNTLWAVDLPADATPTHTGGNRTVIRESSSGVCYIKRARKFWRVQESGYEYVGEADVSFPYSNNEAGGNFLIGDLWAVYSADQNRVGVIEFSSLETGTDTLASIVRSEILGSGLLALSDIDVTSLDQTVRGYKVSQTGAIRGAIEPLRAAWPFDVIQSGYKIKCVRRGAESVATIDASELDAREYGSAPGVQLSIENEMASQLPRRVFLKYLDVSREYDTGEQYSERLNSESVNIRNIDLAIVLSDDEAAGIAEVLLYLYWLERRDVKFTLPPEYRGLEPADVIDVTGEWGNYSFRLTTIQLMSDGRVECQAKYNDSATYTPNASGAAGEVPSGIVGLDGPSYYELLDIPVIDSDQNTPGFASAMCGYTNSWPGGIIYRTIDGGGTWVDLQGFSDGVPIGFARNAVSAGRTDIYDASTVLDIDLLYGSLFSVTELAQLNGANTFAFGLPGRWEIVSARNCVLQADNSYRITDFLRGLYGTEWAASQHQAGDVIVLLDDPDVAFIAASADAIGVEYGYRGITAGRSIDSDTTLDFTYQAVNLTPLSPVYLNGNRHPSTRDWSLTWVRRGRVSAGWRNLIDVPVGETTEAYEIEIYSNSGYTTVLRTLTASSATVSYTSAQQVTDFGSNQSTLYLKIYQMSATVGRGYPLTASITRG